MISARGIFNPQRNRPAYMHLVGQRKDAMHEKRFPRKQVANIL